MRRTLLLILIISLFAMACHKEEEQAIAVKTPMDSVHVFQPYSASYTGTLHNYNNKYSAYTSRIFDTSYSTTLTVNHPDSFRLIFQLAFWEIQRAWSLQVQDSFYYYQESHEYVINPGNSYQDSSHHHLLRFTLRNDSLLIRKVDEVGANYQEVQFAGRRQ